MREFFTKMVTIFGRLIVFLLLLSFTSAKAELRERAEKARAIALNVLAEGYERRANDLYLKLSERLTRAKIEVPENGIDFKHCDPQTLAYVIAPGLSHNEIYFCNRVHYITNAQFAESLIHETSHLLGYNECEAIQIEVNTMTDSGRRPLIQNLDQENCL